MDPAMMRTIHTRGKVDYRSVTAELIYLAELGLIQNIRIIEKYKIIKTSWNPLNCPLLQNSFMQIYGQAFKRNCH